MSERRRKLRDEKRSRKALKMKSPGMESKYSLKKRGIYPANSPYLVGGKKEGNFGKVMKKLRPILDERKRLQEEQYRRHVALSPGQYIGEAEYADMISRQRYP
jgi:hypothetical protein